MSRKKLTRAERYKRNYRLIKNAYQDATLAKKYQSYSDESLYRELGIKITKSKKYKTPELKKVAPDRLPYYKRKLSKYRYARLQELSPEKSRKSATRGYSKKSINKYGEYYKEVKTPYDTSSKEKRIALWKSWSKNEGMQRDEKGKYTGRERVRDKLNLPPEIIERAIQRNREAKHVVNGKLVSMGFDDYDKYGFAFEYFMFVEGSEEKARQICDPTPYGVETYRDTRKVVTVSAS